MTSLSRRVAIGCVMHETNSFNHRATRLEDFDTRYLLYGDDIWQLGDTNTEIAGFMDEAEAHEWALKPLLAAACAPSGPLAEKDWLSLCTELFMRLHAAMPVDAVLLGLHGAMVVEGEHDPEAVLLEGIRRIVGEQVPVVATLDMHANVSERMVDTSDGMITYRTYPHIDQRDTGRRAGQLVAKLLTGEHFSSVLRQPPILDTAAHGRTSPPGPMNDLLAEAEALEGQADVANVSLQIGFPWADVPFAGPSVIVTGRVRARCEAIADQFVEKFLALTDTVEMEFPDAQQAIHDALQAQGQGPVILADFADNPSGGAYGDSPMLLRAMVEARVRHAVFATLCDPDSVEQAVALGIGGRG